MSTAYHTNTKVEWNWGQGVACGYIREIFRDEVSRSIKGTEVTRHGTQGNPAYLIEQAHGDRVLKSHSELRRCS